MLMREGEKWFINFKLKIFKIIFVNFLWLPILSNSAHLSLSQSGT